MGGVAEDDVDLATLDGGGALVGGASGYFGGRVDEVLTLLETLPGGEPIIELEVRPKDAAPVDATNLAWRAARLFASASTWAAA